MSYETQKANRRRRKTFLFTERVFVGKGIDIGSGKDLMRKRGFGKVKSIEAFDLEDGDAQYIDRYRPAETYDFVYSSNCLEHMNDPSAALKAWFSLVKDGGYMAFTVPDEDLYEQGSFPSRFNPGHQWTFTVRKRESWSPKSLNILDLLKQMDDCRIIKVELMDTKYDYSDTSGRDQTKGKRSAEAFIEVVVQKAKALSPAASESKCG